MILQPPPPYHGAMQVSSPNTTVTPLAPNVMALATMALIIIVGLFAFGMLAFDEIVGRPPDATVASVISFVLGILSSLLGSHIGAANALTTVSLPQQPAPAQALPQPAVISVNAGTQLP